MRGQCTPSSVLLLCPQAAQNDCAGRSLQQLDFRLNNLYAKVHKRLENSRDAARLMTASQRAWVSFRNNEFAFLSSSAKNSSIYPWYIRSA
ncbi:lysozyme inhibitor LprI family protein [Acidisphaera sp. L21]|uniref:lysozyme inhibitor LprI family protein n=1 Tax=Acidisphaera sp. L21 TaxID=1641851 RepID=UPI0038D180F5